MEQESELQTPTVIDQQHFFLPAKRKEVIKITILGIILGLLIPLASFLIEQFFIKPVFCSSPDAFGVCATGGMTAYYITTVLFSVLAIVMMANWNVFRPVLIAVAAAAALWGFKKVAGELSVDSFIEYYLYSSVLFAVVYLLFYWILRIHLFAISVVTAVIAVVLIRWALVV